MGRPHELRGVAVWLASDASSFVTGSECVFYLYIIGAKYNGRAYSILVSGGSHAW